MGFLAPAFLIGFFALAIPVIIHLWSKNTQNSKPFGSLRFLAETETKTMRSIMPSQWLLLLTRLLVLTFLVFILAQTFWKGKKEKIETLYLIDTIYEGTEFLKTIQDSVSSENEILWLSVGFPSTKMPAEKQVGDYWRLLANPPQKAKETVVVSPLLLNNFSSSRKSFPVKYTWLKPPVTPESEEFISYRKGDEYLVVNTEFDEWKTSHSLQKADQGEPLELSYYVEVGEAYGVYDEVFGAAISTLNSLSPLTINQTKDLQNADWIIWLSSRTPPKGKNTITINNQSIIKWNEITTSVIQISSDWDREEAIQLNLPEKLLVAFSGGVIDTKNLGSRTMDTRAFSFSLEGNKDNNEVHLQIGLNVLWLGLLLLLLTERWLAFKSEKS